MSKLRAQSRADLLRELQHGRLAQTAILFGFVRKFDDTQTVKVAGQEPATTAALPTKHAPTAPPPTFPKERPSLQLLRATEAQTLAPMTQLPVGHPISESELATPKGRTGIPHIPLIRWSRLASWLRSRLGVVVPGGAPDEARLLRHFTHGEALRVIPRRLRRVWAAEALVLWDSSKEMSLFQEDFKWLEERIKNERGRHGLRILKSQRPPSLAMLGPLAHGTPVLALSAMGQYSRDASVQNAWRHLGQALHWRGHPIQALMPCPRRCWSAVVTPIWPAAQWDFAARLPKSGGQFPMPAQDCSRMLEDFLIQLSPAHRVSPALLRAARLALPDRGDVGLEWQAWRHETVHPAYNGLEFLEGDAWQQRLTRRQCLGGAEAAAADRIAALIATEHSATMSSLRVFEAEVRARLTSPAGEGEMHGLREFLQSIRDRLRQMVAEGVRPSRHTYIGDLPFQVLPMVQSLAPAMRDHGKLHDVLAECCALADTLAPPDTETVLPESVDMNAYRAELGRLPGLRSASRRLYLDVSGAMLCLAPEHPAGNRHALAQVIAAPGALLFDRRHHTLEAQVPGIALPNDSSRAVTLQTSHQRLTLAPITLPTWADKLWYDRYGLAAEFRIRDVPFVLRWIPPGSFLMGSPEDEPGRYDDEGPRHEVTISQGYWVADTPVTQAQWRAVVEAVRSEPALWKKLNLFSKDIQPSPSRFKGPADLPVESVSWHTSQDFCRLLNALLPDGPGFHLPTEAQWEYACRAGTDTALYNGPITIKGENHAPELPEIAWYGGNSGLDLEVSNPESSKGWPNKQFDHQQAGTHRVKLKQANPWGLYDTLGNVWEWCEDAWDAKAYANRSAGVTDPRLDSAADSALRVIRGGSWGNHARYCRSAFRGGVLPGGVWLDQGLRLAAGQNEPRAAEPQEKERSDLPERRSRARRAGGSTPA